MIALHWVCNRCDAIEPVAPTGDGEEYTVGDKELCIDCGEGICTVTGSQAALPLRKDVTFVRVFEGEHVASFCLGDWQVALGYGNTDDEACERLRASFDLVVRHFSDLDDTRLLPDSTERKKSLFGYIEKCKVEK